MRVCHVVECGGGVGNVIIDLVRAGVRAGDDITVIYGVDRAWPEFLETLRNLKSVKLVPSTMKRAVGAHDLVDAIRLYGQLKHNGPFDIIHAHSSKAGALVRIIRFFLPKSVLIYTPHAFMTMAPGASPIYGIIEKMLSPLNDAIICVSEQERQHALQMLHINEHLLHVIPNGIDIHYSANRAEARQKLGAKESDFLIGFVGRLEAQKDPLLAIDAFVKIAAQHPEAKLVMIGYGSLQFAVEQAIAAANLQSRVTIMQDLNGRALIAGFDCLLCSSSYESFGLVIIEALATGITVVTTPVGVAPDAVITGQTGTVTNDFTAISLATGLDDIMQINTSQRAQIAMACKAQANKFSLEKMFGATRELYTKLIVSK